MTCEICTWAVGNYCLKHKDHNLTPCRDYRRIGMKEDQTDHETIEEDYNDYVKYLDDTLPPAEKENKAD